MVKNWDKNIKQMTYGHLAMVFRYILVIESESITSIIEITGF